MKINAIDLFCGAGGLSLGLKSVGISVAAAIDLDDKALETYNRNLGNHAHKLSVATVEPEQLLKVASLRRGECHLIAGGPPCQGFSVQRRGADIDPRNRLVMSFARLVLDIKPPMFLMENVAGLLSPRGEGVLARFSAQTRNGGYHLHIKKLNAADYGVPQLRERVFIIGEWLDRGAAPGFSFPEPVVKSHATVRQAISDLPMPPKDGSCHPEVPNHFREGRLSAKNLERIRNVPEGGGREALPHHLQLACHQNNPGHRHVDVYGRMAWDAPAPTITARFDSFTRGRFGHPKDDRSVTIREGARLQTFPDNFVFLGNREECARQVGNAVPPLLARTVALRIVDALNRRAAKPVPRSRQRVQEAVA